jgi:hypothetical protein
VQVFRQTARSQHPLSTQTDPIAQSAEFVQVEAVAHRPWATQAIVCSVVVSQKQSASARRHLTAGHFVKQGDGPSRQTSVTQLPWKQASSG